MPGGLHAPHFNQIEFCELKIRTFMRNAIAAERPRISNVERSPEAWPDPSKDGPLHGQLAAERWPAQNRVAPLLSFCFLLGHVLMVGSRGALAVWCCSTPCWAPSFSSRAVRFVWGLRKAHSRFRAAQPGTLGNPFECQVRHLVCVAICAEPDAWRF